MLGHLVIMSLVIAPLAIAGVSLLQPGFVHNVGPAAMTSTNPSPQEANSPLPGDANAEGEPNWAQLFKAANIDPNEALQPGPETPEPNTATEQPKPAAPVKKLPPAVTAEAKPVKASAIATHALCAEILSTYVNESGLVDYKTLRRKRLELIRVLNEYSGLDPNLYASWSKEDALAFWINSYNLCVIKAVVDSYPIQPSRFKVLFYPANSVMQISGFWDSMHFNIMGENYSLTEIEQKILKGQFDDPRVCLAINYATAGSPPLRREPYYGKDLDKQFEDQARRFLAMPSGMQINRDEPSIQVSPVFQWYAGLFIAKYPPKSSFDDKSAEDGAVLTFISKHISQKDADWLSRKIYPIKYMRFNWVLNEQR